MTDSTKVLFVCSMNQWRSPTAEAIYKDVPGVSVRSAGTSRRARQRLSLRNIQWADLILVMEEKHRQQIRAQFRDAVRYAKIEVLEIGDLYRYMDEELIAELRAVVDPILELGD